MTNVHTCTFVHTFYNRCFIVYMFTEEQFEPINSTGIVFPEAMSTMLIVCSSLGHEQFVETRLQKGSLMVVDTKILFKLPSSTSALKADTDQIKLNQSTLTKLDSACQNRRAAALELFKTEFTGVPECFVKDGIPLHGTKSDILKSILPHLAMATLLFLQMIKMVSLLMCI